MSEDYVSKLQEDLRKRLNLLSLMHNEPALHVSEHFAELRRQVDLDAERLLSEIQSVKRETRKARKDSDVNGTRLEFIRILEELEKRTGHQPKPQIPASEAFSSFERRVDAFKDSSDSLDDLDESYVQLARKIIDETDRVEKSLLGEQTIIYWPSRDEGRMGSLVYFGDIFLSREEIDSLISCAFQYSGSTRRPQSCSDALLVPLKELDELSKSKLVIQCLCIDNYVWFSAGSMFVYIGPSWQDYSGYSAERTSVNKHFISYKFKKDNDLLQIRTGYCFNTNLFDVYSSTRCRLEIANLRLEGLDVDLVPSPATRLTKLVLTGVHFESFGPHLLGTCTNLTHLELQGTFSKGVKFGLDFLREMTMLAFLKLTLPDTLPSDFSVFKKLTALRLLKLKGTSFFYAEKLPKLSKTVLKQIASPPFLQMLKLSCFDLEAIDQHSFDGCRELEYIILKQNRIDGDACMNIGFPEPCRDFGFPVSSIEKMRSQSLSLRGNSIVDLPRGVFQDLPSLGVLELDNNLIRRIRSCFLDQLGELTELTLTGNPIESIEANAFARLSNLSELSLDRCRLKSIDSEMFNGLKDLRRLMLNDNLIEQIEVVIENECRINVAKANLNDEERELVKKCLFKDFSYLMTLILDGNKLEKIDLNCFSNLYSLEELFLSSNKINELSGEVGQELLPNLVKLHLDDNQLTTIDKRSLPKTLRYLKLSKNKLQRLDEDFFAEFTQLIDLRLDQNELTWTVTEATFASCSFSLWDVDLSQNQSIRVSEGAFREIRSLRWIEADFNDNFASQPYFTTLRIRRKLTPEVVGELKKFNMDRPRNIFKPLKTCCLSNCSIKSLTRDSEWQSKQETPKSDHLNVSWLPRASQLEKLDFSGNLIETLDDSELFVDFSGVNLVNLSDNRLSRIHRNIFKCLPCLKTIDLSGNKLCSIDTGLFRHQKCLKDLNLSSNGIALLNFARLFRICPDLQSLNMADNQLDERSTVEPIDSRTINYLSRLVLANNQLEKMDFVRDMTRLEHLDLRGNRIESVMSNGGENLLGRLFKLTHLDLSRNQLRSLKEEMFIHLRSRFQHLNLSENPVEFQLDSAPCELI